VFPTKTGRGRFFVAAARLSGDPHLQGPAQRTRSSLDLVKPGRVAQIEKSAHLRHMPTKAPREFRLLDALLGHGALGLTLKTCGAREFPTAECIPLDPSSRVNPRSHLQLLTHTGSRFKLLVDSRGVVDITLGRMKPLFLILTLMTFIGVTPSLSQAQRTSDKDLYGQALEIIAAREWARSMVVWDTAIASSTFLSERVPRHRPEYQFSRNVPGVTPKLELDLLYRNTVASDLSGKRNDLRLGLPDSFRVRTGIVPVVGEARLKELETEGSTKGAELNSLAIGFARVAYSYERGQELALVYAEVGSISSSNGNYGGEGFLFAKQSGNWKLKRHTTLWDGGSTPFWRW